MPTYEFECECGERKELLMKIDEAEKAKVECDKCGNIMARVLSAANFKIEGYSYKNRYGLKNKSEKGKKDG